MSFASFLLLGFLKCIFNRIEEMYAVECSAYKKAEQNAQFQLFLLVSSSGKLGSFALARVCFIVLGKKTIAPVLMMNLVREIEYNTFNILPIEDLVLMNKRLIKLRCVLTDFFVCNKFTLQPFLGHV